MLHTLQHKAHIVQIKKTFADEAYVCFLMELLEGSSLFQLLISQRAKFPGDVKEAVRFYASYVLLGIEEIH